MELSEDEAKEPGRILVELERDAELSAEEDGCDTAEHLLRLEQEALAIEETEQQLSRREEWLGGLDGDGVSVDRHFGQALLRAVGQVENVHLGALHATSRRWDRLMRLRLSHALPFSRSLSSLIEGERNECDEIECAT